MELFLFSENYKELEPLTIGNFVNYIENKDILNKYRMGGTNYSSVIKHITKKQKDKVPTFVIFITDGDCWDRTESEKAIKQASSKSIFWQFVGIGNSSFDFLERLDDMEERKVDNADFFKVNKISNMTDEQLYTTLLGEFPEWLKISRNLNITK